MGGNGGGGGIGGRRKSATSTKNFKELSDYMKSEYGVKIAPTLDGKVPFEAVKQAASDLESLYKEFGSVVDIRVISDNESRKNAFASCSFDGHINFNPDQFSSVEKIEKSYEHSVQVAFHPYGTTWKDIMVHEMGHGLVSSLLKKIHGSGGPGTESYYKRVIDWNKNQTCGRIVREAIKAVKAEQRSLGIKPFSTDSWCRSVSDYAGYNRAETIAECVADYRRNRENANPLSREVWKILKRELS